MTLDPKKCAAGSEQWEEFPSATKKNLVLIQYDYRNTKGKLFSCIAMTLEEARSRRDEWAEIHGM